MQLVVMGFHTKEMKMQERRELPNTREFLKVLHGETIFEVGLLHPSIIEKGFL
jgi:hypothetical protein